MSPNSTKVSAWLVRLQERPVSSAPNTFGRFDNSQRLDVNLAGKVGPSC